MAKVGKQAGGDSNRAQAGQAGRQVAIGQAGLMVQTRAVGGGSQAQAKPSRRASRVRITCVVDGAWQTKHLLTLICFYFI